MDITPKNAFAILKKYLETSNIDKFEHSIRVAETAKLLAQKWNAPIQDAIIAGLLHDIGKSITKQQMLELCMQNNLTIYDFEIFANPEALHGKISSLLFEYEFTKDNVQFNEKDFERFSSISHAIQNHVTGNEVMTLLDKIIFIADNVEPNRKNNLLLQIKSDEITKPDEYIKIIIKDKIKRASNKNREPNPLLNLTLESIDER